MWCQASITTKHTLKKYRKINAEFVVFCHKGCDLNIFERQYLSTSEGK